MSMWQRLRWKKLFIVSLFEQLLKYVGHLIQLLV